MDTQLRVRLQGYDATVPGDYTIEGVPIAELAETVQEPPEERIVLGFSDEGDGDDLALITEDPTSLPILSQEDVEAYFTLQDTRYDRSAHSRLVSELRFGPARDLFFFDLYPAAVRYRSFLQMDDLSPRTRCEIQKTGIDLAGPAFELYLAHHAAETQQDASGPKWTTNLLAVFGTTWMIKEEKRALVKAILSDIDPARRRMLLQYFAGMGCAEADFACYEKVIKENLTSESDSMSTYTDAERTVGHMRYVDDHRALFPASVTRMLEIGTGLVPVDRVFGAAVPMQTYEPFALMDVAVDALGADIDRLRIDVIDVNAHVIGHLQRAVDNAAAGRPYPLYIGRKLGDPFDLFRGPPPLAGHLPLHNFRYLLGDNAFGKRMDIDASVVQNIHPLQGNIATDAIAPEGTYDVIVMLHVHHYLSNIELMIAFDNIHRLLRGGGILFADFDHTFIRWSAECLRLPGDHLVAEHLSHSRDIEALSLHRKVP